VVDLLVPFHDSADITGADALNVQMTRGITTPTFLLSVLPYQQGGHINLLSGKKLFLQRPQCRRHHHPRMMKMSSKKIFPENFKEVFWGDKVKKGGGEGS